MGGSIDELLRTLVREKGQVSRKTLDALAACGDDAVEPLARLMTHEESGVKDTAIEVLAAIGTPRVTPHMLLALRVGKVSRYDAANHLARKRDPQTLAPLVALAHDADRHVAGAALFSLARFDDRSVLPQLLPLLDSPDADVREDAVETIGQLGGSEVFAPIAAKLKDSSWLVRAAAAKALGTMRHPQAADVLIPALEAEPDYLAIEYMGRALAELGASRAAPLMLRRIPGFPGRDLLSYGNYVRALATVKGACPPEVSPLLTSTDRDMRAAAALVLGNSGSPEAVPPLVGACSDPDRRVRVEARKALGQLRAAGVVVRRPGAGLQDTAAALAEALASYFCTPTSEGFSAYRTGWIAHFGFSALAATALVALATQVLGLAPLSASGTALTGVVLLWGVGVWLGVNSHYNPLISLGVVLTLIGLVVLGVTSVLLGLPIAFAAHLLMRPISAAARLLGEWLA